MCVSRTAELVLLTCWPPAPDARNTSILMILVADLDVDLVVDDRIDEHRREARVPPRLRVERRDAHETMHARSPP